MRNKFSRPALFLLAAGAVAAAIGAAKLIQQMQTDAYPEGAMEITDKQRSLMNNKIYQFWRFVMLNLKILKAVDHSKRS